MFEWFGLILWVSTIVGYLMPNPIYIYIYKGVLFGPVKPELGVIPSGQKKTFNSEHLNFPGKELNITDITEQ